MQPECKATSAARAYAYTTIGRVQTVFACLVKTVYTAEPQQKAAVSDATCRSIKVVTKTRLPLE